MDTKLSWFAWALLSAFFAALTAIFAKIGVAEIDSDYATLVRTIIIGIILSIFVVTAGKWVSPLELNKKSLVYLTLSALATGASWVCYFRALKVGPVSKVAPVDKLSLVLAAILAVIFLHERPAPKDWLSIILIIFGVVLLGK